ncbi:hypothetical protein JXB27_00755 [Candidatus Woesearchaeota archaeon]|nr:hypothetical protein [Candidatus Woesearchaeota archaeon]
MDETIKKDIISMLGEAISLVEKNDFAELKELSNHTIHDASIYQDQDSIQCAVVVYALSKIIERTEEEGRKINATIVEKLRKAKNSLENNKEEQYRNLMRVLLKEIAQTDDKLLMFIQNVIEKANVVKGSKIHGHGISIAKTAEILGINQWDLMSFIGKTRIPDKEEIAGDITKRLSFAKKLFKVAK